MPSNPAARHRMRIMFIGTAALFFFGTLACLWHLRWIRRLPAPYEIAIAEGASSRSTIRCSIVVAARNEEMRVGKGSIVLVSRSRLIEGPG